MTDAPPPAAQDASEPEAPVGPVPVFFVSDSTGISAEMMGSALLSQFPHVQFERHLMPFIATLEDAQRARARLEEAMQGPVRPLVFMTCVDDTVRALVEAAGAPIIDFVGTHIERVEDLLGMRGEHVPARLHGLGERTRYDRRMAAVEFAIEHDDGQSVRALERADIILIAPSRCGKTPTSMYLALQHGLFVANYPLVDEDFDSPDLPRPIATMADRCFGLLTSPERLAQVRHERRPDSRYASLQQTTWELDKARRMYERHGIGYVDSSNKSVEEMATIILQSMGRGRG